MDEQGVLNGFADDLERFFVGEIEADTIRDRYWQPGMPPQIGKVMPYVEHLLADADIRAKDVDYNEMQRECLCVLVACLRQGARPQDYHTITFLSRPRRKGRIWRFFERVFGK